MTLQASGAITPSDIRTEFGGLAPDQFSEYYRGGTLVHNITPNASIPTSGSISPSDFYSTGNDDLNLTLGRSVSDIQFGFVTQTAHAGFRFEPNGNLYEVTSEGETLISTDWLGTNRANAGTDYEIKVEIYSGSIDTANSDSVNTWLQMSSNRTWRCFAKDPSPWDGSNTQQAKIKIFIRDLSDVVRVEVNPADPGGIGNSQLWSMSAVAARV